MIRKKFVSNTRKKRNGRPNVGGVCIRSRNGVSSRKGCVVNGQRAQGKHQASTPPLAHQLQTTDSRKKTISESAVSLHPPHLPPPSLPPQTPNFRSQEKKKVLGNGQKLTGDEHYRSPWCAAFLPLPLPLARGCARCRRRRSWSSSDDVRSF